MLANKELLVPHKATLIDIGAKTSSWSDTINIGTNSLAYSPGSIAVGIGSQSFGGSNSYMGATAIGPYSYAKGS